MAVCLRRGPKEGITPSVRSRDSILGAISEYFLYQRLLVLRWAWLSNAGGSLAIITTEWEQVPCVAGTVCRSFSVRKTPIGLSQVRSHWRDIGCL